MLVYIVVCDLQNELDFPVPAHRGPPPPAAAGEITALTYVDKS